VTGRVVSPHIAGLGAVVGRAGELHGLRAAFPRGNDEPIVLVLSGMGGVGKTSLARAYAQGQLGNYVIAWWVRAEDPAVIDAEFRALLEILLPPGEVAQVRDARSVAFAQLAKQDDHWLLVLDNVPDAEAAYGLLPPAGRGHVLITTRSIAWPDTTTVRPLELPAAVELLTARSGDADRGAAEALARELGGLPLALTQAAGFSRSNNVDLATYLRLYRDRSAELHKDGRPADYPHTVSTTWQLAIDRLSEKARDMLNVLAFYAPDAIPVQLLFSSWDELTRHRAIGELHAHSLVNPARNETVTIHRLIQAATRNRLHADLVGHECAEQARNLLVAALPEPPETVRTLAVWNELRTHVHAIVDHLPPHQRDTLRTRDKLAFWTWKSEDPAQARDMYAELLAIRERVLGAEHPDTMITRQNVANLTGHAGDPQRARDLLSELQTIRDRVLGTMHPRALSNRNALAWWTGVAGDAARARDLFAELLPLREQVLGADDVDSLKTRHNLAHWTGEAGDATRARDLFAELNVMRERVFGVGSRHTLGSRMAHARWSGHAGDALGARDLLAALLPVAEPVLGAESLLFLSARFELAYWTERAGDPIAARALFAELLPTQEKVLGTEHLDTVRTREALATLDS
jgi:hypothetical protein